MGASRWLIHALSAVAGLLIYLSAVSGEFVYDDLTYIQQNPSVLGQTGVFDQPLAPQFPELGLYRPVTVLTYRWTYQLAGMEPLPFHLGNALLHALASLLVVTLAGFLGASRTQAGLAGLLFAVHPIHVEAVAWVVGRAEILATCFGLLAILAHGRPTDRRPFARTGLAALLFFAGALSKESALCLPAFLFLHDLVRRGDAPLRRVALRLLPSALVCLAVIALRGAVLGHFGPDVSEHLHLAGLTLLERAQLGLAVIGRALQLLIVPHPTSVHYDPRPFFTTSAATVGALLAFLVLALMAWVQRRRNQPALLGLLLFAVGLLPFLHLVPFGEVFADRFLYLASTGFCITAASLLFGAGRRPAGAVRRALALAALLAFSALTLQSSPAFRNSIALWEDAVRSQPSSAFAHFQLAYFYRQAGLIEYESESQRGALFCYAESLRVDPEHAQAAEAHLRLGEHAARQGDAITAAHHYREALQRAPDMYEAMLDLAALEPKGGVSREQARELLIRALGLDPPEELAQAAEVMLQALED